MPHQHNHDFQPPTFVLPSLLTMIVMVLVGSLAIICLDALATSLHQHYGLNRLWAFVILTSAGIVGYKAWVKLRRKWKAAKHDKWVDGLGGGFAHLLEKAKEEARQPVSFAEHLREFGATGCGKLPTLVSAEQRHNDNWRRKGKRPARKGR